MVSQMGAKAKFARAKYILAWFDATRSSAKSSPMVARGLHEIKFGHTQCLFRHDAPFVAADLMLTQDRLEKKIDFHFVCVKEDYDWVCHTTLGTSTVMGPNRNIVFMVGIASAN
jgi:hypothetical protein